MHITTYKGLIIWFWDYSIPACKCRSGRGYEEPLAGLCKNTCCFYE